MISTGIQKLDEFLHGGISPGIITDIFGKQNRKNSIPTTIISKLHQKWWKNSVC